MREQLRRHGIPESTELPDHLTHLLLLVDRMQRDEAAQLAGEFLLPALTKIIGAVQDPQYRSVLRGIEQKLQSDFPDAPRRPARLPIFQEAACE
jgi:TorA maturation chaperone TorD